MSMRAPKAGEPVSRNWRYIEEIIAALEAEGIAVSGSRAAIAGLRRPKLRDSFPFRTIVGSTRLKAIVAPGMVVTLAGKVNLGGTTEITLDDAEPDFCIYVDLAADPIALATSADPDWSTDIIPIAFADTTGATTVIDQFWYGNIYRPC